MTKPEISLICVYNKPDMYKNVLISSLKKIKAENIEVIGVNSVKEKFTSASAALNHGVKLSHGDILLFVHQDIEFLNPEGLSAMVEAVRKTKTGDIIGAAGTALVNGRPVLCTSILWGKLYKTYNAIRIRKGELRPVEAVDECFFGMKRETWEQHPFDEKTCDDWHFYAVELCMYARSKKHQVYVTKVPVNHLSEAGTKTKGYFDTMVKLAEKYQSQFEYIVSPTAFIKISDVKKRANHAYIKLFLKIPV